MSDEQQNPAEETESSESSAENQGQKVNVDSDELLNEFSKLGQAIAEAVKTAWASDERKRLEQDLNRGLSTVVATIEEAIGKIGKSEQAKQVLDRAEDVAEKVGKKVRESDVTAEVVTGLQAGISSLTEELEKFTSDLAKSEAKDGGEEAQDIPVSQPEEGTAEDEESA